MSVPFREEIVSLLVAGASAAALVAVVATIQKAPTIENDTRLAPFGVVAVDATQAATGDRSAYYETALTGEPVWEFDGVSPYHHTPPSEKFPEATPVYDFYGIGVDPRQ